MLCQAYGGGGKREGEDGGGYSHGGVGVIREVGEASYLEHFGLEDEYVAVRAAREEVLVDVLGCGNGGRMGMLLGSGNLARGGYIRTCRGPEGSDCASEDLPRATISLG